MRPFAATEPTMTLALRRFAAAFVTFFAAALPAVATSYSTDYSDLWYRSPAESESGWGVNVIQQNNIIFATLFVYGPDNTPRWYVAPATVGQNTSTFTGPLFTTTGTYFGSPWVGVTSQQVGTVTFNFNSPSQGVLTYTVGNVTVVKNIVRQTFGGNLMTGNYLGGMTAIGSACRNGAVNGAALIFGELTVNHSNFNQPSFTVDFVNGAGVSGTCTFTGAYSQLGRLGSVNNGTFSCTFSGQQGGNVGTFSLSQIFVSQTGLTSRFQGSDQFCNYDGFFGGIKDVL